MGILDFLKGSPKDSGGAAETAVGGGAVVAGAAAEQSAVSSLLGSGGEKLSGLLDKLNVGGLDDAVKSWIGKGENKAVSADQVKAALGSDEVKAVAAKMGVTEDAAASKIATMLPSIIDKLTPDGLVPDPNALATKVTGLLKM